MFFILSHKVGLNLLDPEIVVIECHMHVILLHGFWIRIEDLVICTNIEISYHSGFSVVWIENWPSSNASVFNWFNEAETSQTG